MLRNNSDLCKPQHRRIDNYINIFPQERKHEKKQMKDFMTKSLKGTAFPGHDGNFCSDLPRRASEIQFSLALEKLYIIII